MWSVDHIPAPDVFAPLNSNYWAIRRPLPIGTRTIWIIQAVAPLTKYKRNTVSNNSLLKIFHLSFKCYSNGVNVRSDLPLSCFLFSAAISYLPVGTARTAQWTKLAKIWRRKLWITKRYFVRGRNRVRIQGRGDLMFKILCQAWVCCE